MTLIISFSIDLHQHKALLLSSHGLLNRNSMNHSQLERRDPQQEQSIRAILEQKGSHILKNTINKISNGRNNVIWISANVQNKSSITKDNRAIDKGDLPRKMTIKLQQPPSA
ncbi:hypothetical protein CR513_38194, partial [Mucuna pruriens]